MSSPKICDCVPCAATLMRMFKWKVDRNITFFAGNESVSANCPASFGQARHYISRKNNRTHTTHSGLLRPRLPKANRRAVA